MERQHPLNPRGETKLALRVMPFRVEFAHTDMGQVMFFGRYLELAHRAYEDLVCDGLEMEWGNWFRNPDWIVPIRALNVDFLSPLPGGTECEIQARVENSGKSSFTHTYTFVAGGKVAAVVRLTSVFVDKKTFRKIPIPDLVRKALEEYTLKDTANR